MEYHFCRDPLGMFDTQFSMDHEAMGNWLITELGTKQEKISPLLEIVESLLMKERWDYELKGQDFHLYLSRDQADVKAALLETDMMDEDTEDLDYYDNESSSHCGLIDFKNMLISWLEFTSK